MDLFWHVIEHSVEDTLPLVPFLFLTYLALELLEHAAGARAGALVRRAGAAGPVVGALLGIVPQCGFSAMGATLYAGRVITLGTLIAVFLSTSDEMLPLLVAEQVDAGLVATVLLTKAAVAAVVGLAADACVRALRNNPRAHALVRRGVHGAAVSAAPDLIDELAEAGEGTAHIHRLCEHDHCGCDDDGEPDVGRAAVEGPAHPEADGRAAAPGGQAADGHAHRNRHHHHAGPLAIVRSALSHTVQVTLFIFLVTLVLVAVLEGAGEEALAGFLAGNETLAVFASALVGLIPNCAASVVVTQLYLEGVLSFSAMIAGTLVGAGTGFLVLFRTNRSLRENLVILVLLYLVGAVAGLALMALGL